MFRSLTTFFKKHYAAAVIIAALAASAVYGARAGWFGGGDSQVNFDLRKISNGSITAKVTATGTLSALVTVQVGAQVSGRIAKIYVDYNSIVKKGDLLAKIDPVFFEAALEQSKANAMAAEANLEKALAQEGDAERTLKRLKTLLDKNLAAQSDVDTAQTNYDTAKAQVSAAKAAIAQAKAALKQAEINLSYATIVSPINGVVISRSIDVGQTVASNFQAPTLFTIAEDLGRMQVDTNVSESDISKLKDGMTATFSVDAYPNETFTGKIRQIRNASQSVQNVVTYDAVIDVENPDMKLKPGMTASVTFVHAHKSGVLVIPNAALRFKMTDEISAALEKQKNDSKDGPKDAGASEKKPAGGIKDASSTPANVKTIWIMRSGRPVQVVIKTGITDGSMTEIIEGDVKDGDEAVADASIGKAAPKTKQNKNRPPGMF